VVKDRETAAEWAESLAQQTRRAVARKGLDVALRLVTALAIEAGVCDDSSIAQWPPEGGLETAAQSDELVVTAHKAQYSLNEGPCVAAVYTDDVLVSEDVAADERWPRWGKRAAALGIRAVISVPRYTDDDSAMGALNLYSVGRRNFTEDDRGAGRLVEAHASVTLAHFRGQAHLWKAIDAWHIIGIAQGVVRHQYQVSAGQAFTVLRRQTHSAPPSTMSALVVSPSA
jgi:GAF domain-containing protein